MRIACYSGAQRMIQELSSRTEGYTDGRTLIPGRRPNAFQPDE